MLVWGYKPGGESRLFDLEDGAVLPEGWTDDVMVIKDPNKRTGEAITEAAGTDAPVRITAVEESRRVHGKPQK